MTSAIALNFVPDRIAALRDMQRVCRPNGLISFYVWDYPGGGMGFIDAFWKAAIEFDPAAAELDEGARFPYCTPTGLKDMCMKAELPDATVAPIEIATDFPTFADLWHPFTLGAGPAPGYLANLEPERQVQLREILKRRIGDDEPVSLSARAWSVRTTNSS